MRKEGVYFSNCYANSFRTDRGILSVFSGWPGMPTLSLIKRTDLCRCLPSVASSLRAEGYATSMTYGGDIDFTNMRLYFSETGFSTVRGSHYFPASQNTSAWGVHDQYLLAPGVLIPAERPFFSTALTLSSHEPWEVPMQRLRHPRWNSFAYTDSCLGAFIDQLKAMPLLGQPPGCHPARPRHHLPGVHSTADVRRLPHPHALDGRRCAWPKRRRPADEPERPRRHPPGTDGLPISAFPFSRNVFSPSFSQRRQFAMHADKNGLNLIHPEGHWVYDCVSRSCSPFCRTSAFVEARLQRLYQTSAALPLSRRERQ